MNSTKRGVRRVFVGPVEIAGIASGLVQGLRECSVDAQVMLSTPHPFQYGSEPVSWLIRVWQKIGAARTATPRQRLLRKLLLAVAHDLWGGLVLARVLASFDAFIFIFGQTLTNSKFELWLLKRLGKKIVFIYCGSDSRPPYIDGARYPGLVSDDLPKISTVLRIVRRCKRKIRLHEHYADYVINSPTTAHFLERRYINWFAMGIPRVLPNFLPGSTAVSAKPGMVRILHSPSNPLVKGTEAILSALDNLRKKGYLIDLIKIQGMPNEVVLRELAQCDFVVDQLYADTPLATFATEAAFFGKPAIVGGYFANTVADCLAAEDIPPSMFVLPDELESAIERLILDAELRRLLGERARQFVSTHWSLHGVARRYVQLLNDEVPDQWWCDPASVSYLEGCGLPRGRAKRLISLLVDRFGADALQLHDKPELEADFVKFAQEPREQE